MSTNENLEKLMSAEELKKTLLIDRKNFYNPTVERMKKKFIQIEMAFDEIIRWEDAYPLDMFPEQDIEKARRILADNGISLTCLFAHGMRHVVTRCAEIVRKAME